MISQQTISGLKPGKYVVAVSGGVDSMVLLDLLRCRSDLSLIVAHANHGIRDDSHLDEKLVSQFCKSHNILLVSKELHLGKNTSEETARSARYNFLQHCRIEKKANAIITAHHQDDLIETVLINLLRGTGWRGLAPFTDQDNICRPFINTSKSELYAYAKKRNVPWREDSTNTDTRYLRNYVRHKLIPSFEHAEHGWREQFLRLIRSQTNLRRTITNETNTFFASAKTVHDRSVLTERYMWIMLPPAVAYELFQELFRQTLGNSLLRSQAEAALLFAKVARVAKTMPLSADWQLRATKRELIVEPRQSVVS